MSKRVLVVDDHAPTRSLIRAVLERERSEQIEIVEATCGKECLQKFDKEGPFDLILLDVQMDDLDGYTVCKALRNVDKDVPIVFVTAKAEFKDYTEGREAGGDSYLVKPISRAALRSLVALFTSVQRKKDGPESS